MFLSLLSKELKQIFSSPTTFIVCALFSFLCGWFFLQLLLSYVDQIQAQSGQSITGDLISFVIFKFFGNVNFLMVFLSPIISTRFFSLEYNQQTFVLLEKSRLSHWQIIGAKYLASLFQHLFMLSSITLMPMILWFAGAHDYSYFIAGCIGIFFNMAMFAAIGLWVSSLFENLVVAAFVHYVILLSFWLINYLGTLTSNYTLVRIWDYIGMSSHFENVLQGVLSSSDFFYFLSIIFLFLFFIKKNLELRSIQ